MQFYRHDTPTRKDGLVVRYCELPDTLGGLEINVSRKGVVIFGHSRWLHTVVAMLAVLEHAKLQYDTIQQKHEALPFEQDPIAVIEYRKSSRHVASREKCEVCDGEGFESPQSFLPCKNCGGSSYVVTKAEAKRKP